MEWCRMNTPRAVMCVVLLCCGLHHVMPDKQTMSDRDQKLQELLKSLDSFATELEPKVSTTTSTTASTSPSPPHFLPASPLLEYPYARSKLGSYDDLQNENLYEDTSPMKSYEDFYRVFYGTQEGVNLLRKQYGPNGLQKARAKYGVQRSINDVKAANDHYRKIHDRAKCRKPVPQVIKVKDYYPDPSKEYLPRCTLLHRCGDDTGCCDMDTDHCAPSAIQEVTLHFYVLTMDRYGIRNPNRNSIEKLLFVNHTACSCLPINNLPRIQDGRHHIKTVEEIAESKCRECPVPFTSRIYKDGRCGCDCFDKQKPCIRIKRGREPLRDIERRCVESNHCHIPDCEYGLYDSRTGYCPRRHDEAQRVPPHRRQYHKTHSQRWAFVERD